MLRATSGRLGNVAGTRPIIPKVLTMRTIHKQNLTIQDRQTIEVPEGADLLSIQIQRNSARVWYLCNDDNPKETVVIHCRGTGHPMPDGNLFHIGTTQHNYGNLVFHWFEDAQRA